MAVLVYGGAVHDAAMHYHRGVAGGMLYSASCTCGWESTDICNSTVKIKGMIDEHLFIHRIFPTWRLQ